MEQESGGPSEAQSTRATDAGIGSSARGGARGHARWWVAVVLTTILALPLAWVLSYAAALPFFLGVFFFLLAGLIVGAVAHRLAAPSRPFAATHVVAGVTVVVLGVWLVSLMKEARELPKAMAQQAERVRDIGGLTLEGFHTAVESEVRDYIREHYPPGGTLGYVRWVVHDGTFEPGELRGVERKLQAAQRGATWMTRVALSVALLAFGVGSQTFTLRLQREPSVRAIDA